VLRTVDEPPVKKKFNWDRLLFILALLVIVGYFVNKVYNSVTFIKVHGQVILDKMAVNFTDDIRLMEICVKEGDAITVGDTLFMYTYEDKEQIDNDVKNLTINNNRAGSGSSWFLREKLNVKRQIAIKDSRKKGVKVALAAKKQELAEQERQILLGVDVAHKLPPILSDITEHESDLDALRREIKILKRHLYSLRKQEKAAKKLEDEHLKTQIAANVEYRNTVYYYVTPTQGEIGQINNSPNEVCYKSKDVMVIHQLENLKIKAYFNQQLYQEIRLGEEVLIEFPDGTTSKGVIDNFYVSTYELPPEFQKKYEPVERSIVVDVLPLDMDEAGLWIGYYKMAVTVVKRKR
ncbi:MAG: hypothetical protein AAF985_22150, partial [Bacteroidota bacterium]